MSSDPNDAVRADAGGSPRLSAELVGSLEQMPVPDLLQTLEITRRSGAITFTRGDRTARLWVRDGRVIHAAIDGGTEGQEAVYELAEWTDGNFEVEFGPVSVPERISVSTSFLMLEAMRRRDEARRQEEAPPYAALDDPPPPPPRALLAIHRGLTLLTITTAYAANHLERSLLARRFEEARQKLVLDHETLELFRVGEGGDISFAEDVEDVHQIDVDALVTSIVAWIGDLFTTFERALPGRFSLTRLRGLTEAVQEDLSSLGFYRELGLETEETD